MALLGQQQQFPCLLFLWEALSQGTWGQDPPSSRVCLVLPIQLLSWAPEDVC